MSALVNRKELVQDKKTLFWTATARWQCAICKKVESETKRGMPFKENAQIWLLAQKRGMARSHICS